MTPATPQAVATDLFVRLEQLAGMNAERLRQGCRPIAFALIDGPRWRFEPHGPRFFVQDPGAAPAALTLRCRRGTLERLLGSDAFALRPDEPCSFAGDLAALEELADGLSHHHNVYDVRFEARS